jgi:hypothetical protein
MRLPGCRSWGEKVAAVWVRYSIDREKPHLTGGENPGVELYPTCRQWRFVGLTVDSTAPWTLASAVERLRVST